MRAVRAWRASYDPALRVAAGERVAPGRLDDDNPGWRWVENAAGLGGWVPDAAVRSGVMAEAFDTAELTVAAGDRLEPVEARLGWVRARAADGREGWLPADCVAEA